MCVLGHYARVKTSVYQPGGLYPKHTGMHVDFPHWVSRPTRAPFFFLVGFIFRYRTGKDPCEPFLVQWEDLYER